LIPELDPEYTQILFIIDPPVIDIY